MILDGEDNLEEYPLGKYGMLRETSLTEHHHGTYTSMLLAGRLTSHLQDIGRQVQEQIGQTVAVLMKQNGVNEELRARNQMAWVQAVNSLTSQDEDMALAEIVYK